MNGSDMDESENLAFVVKRRHQDADTGQTAIFTVRVETDRSGPDLALVTGPKTLPLDGFTGTTPWT